MKKQLISIMIGLTAASGLLLIAYIFLAAIFEKLNTLETDLSKAMVIAGFTALGAILSLSVGKVIERRNAITQHIREKKIPIYEEQLSLLFNVMMAERAGKESPKQEEIVEVFARFTERLIVWGGPAVIKEWIRFRTHPWETSTLDKGMNNLESFILALRKDLGNSNSGLEKGDLLRLFINDLDFDQLKEVRPDSPQLNSPATSPARE